MNKWNKSMLIDFLKTKLIELQGAKLLADVLRDAERKKVYEELINDFKENNYSANNHIVTKLRDLLNN